MAAMAAVSTSGVRSNSGARLSRHRRQRWMLSAAVVAVVGWLSYRLVDSVIGAIDELGVRSGSWAGLAVCLVVAAPVALVVTCALIVRTGDLDRSGSVLVVASVALVVVLASFIAFGLFDVVFLST